MVRECEMKMELRSDREVRSLEDRLLNMGYEACDERTELDFVPDNPGYTCRKAGLLLRFRLLRRPTTAPETLVTLKIKNTATNGFQDNEELEFYLDGRAEAHATFENINTVLRDQVDLELPETLWTVQNFTGIYNIAVHEMRMTERRALIEKHRRTFVHSDITVSIDSFHDNVGRFIEIETKKPGDLFLVLYELSLPQARQDSRTYGQIVAAKKAAFPEAERRVCVFPETRPTLDDFGSLP